MQLIEPEYMKKIFVWQMHVQTRAVRAGISFLMKQPAAATVRVRVNKGPDPLAFCSLGNRGEDYFQDDFFI